MEQDSTLVQMLILAIAFVMAWLGRIAIQGLMGVKEETPSGDCVSHKWYYDNAGPMRCSVCKKKAGDV